MQAAEKLPGCFGPASSCDYLPFQRQAVDRRLEQVGRAASCKRMSVIVIPVQNRLGKGIPFVVFAQVRGGSALSRRTLSDTQTQREEVASRRPPTHARHDIPRPRLTFCFSPPPSHDPAFLRLTRPTLFLELPRLRLQCCAHLFALRRQAVSGLLPREAWL